MEENCLVRCLKPKKDLETFDDLRLAAFNGYRRDGLEMNAESYGFT